MYILYEKAHMQDYYYDFVNKTHAGLTTRLHFWFMVGILFYSKVTLAKTEMIYPKNVGAQVAMNFT
jgi:hypothetical protein